MPRTRARSGSSAGRAARADSGQSFVAVRAVFAAGPRDPARARCSSSSSSCLVEPPVAPRMKNTAQAAHINQMPTITSHFSISPTLGNPVYLFARLEPRTVRAACRRLCVLLYIGA
jgi:hypothetical protein